MAEIQDISGCGDMKSQIDKAIGVHGLWKKRIRDAIASGKSEFQPVNVKVNNKCDFGKWLGTLPISAKGEDYKVVVELHTKFHKEAGRILELAITGKKAEAEKAIALASEYANLTSSLTGAMMKWKRSV